WQGGADGCGTPVAPHDGSAPASFYYDESAGQLTLTGKGAHLGLPKAVNGQELSSSSSAPDSVTYDVLTLSADGSYMSVTVETAPGVWWSFNLAKVPVSALAGSWALDGEGAAGVGPTEGSMEWWSADASVVADRACWFDDAFVFGDDGSFSNVMGDETWVEAWQGGADSCATPVAPHDGSSAGSFSYDETAGTITINGRGLYLGLPKAVNGSELSSSESAPDSIVYNVLTATSDGKYLTVSVEAATGVWWTFNLAKNTSGGNEPAPQPEPEPEPEPVNELGTGDDNVLNVDEVIDFNSTIADYGLTDFGGNASQLTVDPTDASNTVLWITKNADQPWAGTTIAKGNVVYPLTATELGMSVRVWSPTAGITVRLKIEESTNGDNFIEADVVTTVAEDWETLVFDFGSPAGGEFSADHVYDTLSIFMNFNVVGTGESYYADDIKFIGAIPAPAPDAGSELVTNGDFQSGITGWEGGAAAADNLTSYFAVAETTSAEVYEVNLSQTMTLVPDTQYTVSFSAKSSIERTMIAGLGLYHDPWTNVGEDVSLTTEWQTFELVQVTSKDGAGFGDEESRILFDMGGAQGGQVWIDNVSVTNADGEELVKNGDFQSGITDWEGGAAVADNLTSYFAVANTTSAEVYEVNLSQTMTLVPDTEYTVVFSAKSSIERTMIAGLGLYHDPWTNVGEDVSLTTEWQTYELVQTTTKDGVGFGDAESRILFDMGGSQGGQVWIDNVSVK
ncbi:MAG: carbohydrate binding domain-containing protein, partial [Porticoccaceae bacterium]|nr:carbohydrate binding domain-containing protein [Porticoccaceae bacterium]